MPAQGELSEQWQSVPQDDTHADDLDAMLAHLHEQARVQLDAGREIRAMLEQTLNTQAAPGPLNGPPGKANHNAMKKAAAQGHRSAPSTPQPARQPASLRDDHTDLAFDPLTRNGTHDARREAPVWPHIAYQLRRMGRLV